MSSTAKVEYAQGFKRRHANEDVKYTFKLADTTLNSQADASYSLSVLRKTVRAEQSTIRFR